MRFSSIRIPTGSVVFAKSSAIKIGILAANALQVLVIVRVLDSVTYALYAAVYTNITVAVNVARSPIERLFQRGAEKNGETLSIAYPKQEFVSLQVFSALVSCLVFLGITVSQGLGISFIGYAVLTISVIVATGSCARRGYLMIMNKTDKIDILDYLVRPFLFIISIYVMHLMGVDVDAWMIVILGLSYLVPLSWPNLVVGLQVMVRSAYGTKRLLYDWLSYFLTTTLSVGSKNMDVILLTYFVPGPSVGSYFLLARMADLLSFGNSYANLRYTHAFARSYRVCDSAKIATIINRAALVSGGIAIVGAAIGLGSSPWLARIQPGLDAYMPVFAILLIAQVVNGVCGPNGAFLSALEPGFVMTIKAVTGVAAVVLMPVMIHLYGLTGAAITNAATISIFNIVCYASLRRRLRVAV